MLQTHGNCEIEITFLINVWVPEVGNTADTSNPPGFSPYYRRFGIGFEPTTSRLDQPMLYRLSYEVSTGADSGNLGSKSR